MSEPRPSKTLPHQGGNLGSTPGARSKRGQTMTEYALILAAIAVVVYGTYRALGNNIGSLANGVDSALTNA